MSQTLVAEVPAWVEDLASFRRWAESDGFPERGRFDFLRGDVWADVEPEQLLTHSAVKTGITTAIYGLVQVRNAGYVFAAGARFTSESANVSTEPDALYVSYDVLHTRRARLVPGRKGGFVEIEGAADWVLEIVSDWSVKKDTDDLPDAYWRAGVIEYWLIDVREDPLRFEILRQTDHGFTPVESQDGWRHFGDVRSRVSTDAPVRPAREPAVPAGKPRAVRSQPMKTYQAEVVIEQDGALRLQELPFRAGDRVQVTIQDADRADEVVTQRYPLRGSVIRYDDPFGPAVPEDDWEALQ